MLWTERGQLHFGDMHKWDAISLRRRNQLTKKVLNSSTAAKHHISNTTFYPPRARYPPHFHIQTHHSNYLLRKYGEIIPRMWFILHNLIYIIRYCAYTNYMYIAHLEFLMFFSAIVLLCPHKF